MKKTILTALLIGTMATASFADTWRPALFMDVINSSTPYIGLFSETYNIGLGYSSDDDTFSYDGWESTTNTTPAYSVFGEYKMPLNPQTSLTVGLMASWLVNASVFASWDRGNGYGFATTLGAEHKINSNFYARARVYVYNVKSVTDSTGFTRLDTDWCENATFGFVMVL